MGFLLEFFFGPCMNHSAVDERQYQHYETPPSSRHHQRPPREQPQSQQHLGVTYSSNGSYQGSYRSSSGHRPKPTTSSSSKRMLSIPENEEAANNGNLRRSANGGSLRNSGNGHTLQNHKSSKNPSSLSGNTRQSKQSRDPSEISSLSDTFNNKRRSRTRRDDASVISQSLFETYQGYMGSEPDLDEQSAIRRSLKDSVPKVVKKKKKRPSPPPSQQSNGRSPLGNHISQTSSKHHSTNKNNSSDASQKTDLESWIEQGGATKSGTSNSRKSGTSLDVDNVTTISKASKNPYSVLGISHGASPKEIYSSYKRRLKETSQHQQYDIGSERAFADVGNAYRRIYADIKRQEARRERKRVIETQQPQSQSQLQLQSSPQASSSGRGKGGSKKKKSKRGRRRNQQQQQSSESDEESDAKSRREGIESRLKDHSQLVHQLFANDNAGTSGITGKKSSSNNNNKRLSSGSSVTSKGQVMTLQNSVHSQSQSLSEMNLVPIEAGAANINERNETIQNSCFYLSLASSYLSGVGAFTNDPTAMYYLNTLRETTATPSKNSVGQSVATVEMEIATLPPKEKQLTMNLALQLKRAIEAAVLLVHPEWAKSGMVGEEVQAFSDFLVYALDSDSVLGHWAIAVFDEASGFVDVYRGRHYGKVYPPTKVRSSGRSSGRDSRTREGGGGSSSVKWRYKDCDEKTKRANTLTLRYIPGHYQPLLPELTKMYNERKRDQSRGRATSRYKRPMLEEILAVLERWNVLHVVTDGRA